VSLRKLIKYGLYCTRWVSTNSGVPRISAWRGSSVGKGVWRGGVLLPTTPSPLGSGEGAVPLPSPEIFLVFLVENTVF